MSSRGMLVCLLAVLMSRFGVFVRLFVLAEIMMMGGLMMDDDGQLRGDEPPPDDDEGAPQPLFRNGL